LTKRAMVLSTLGVFFLLVCSIWLFAAEEVKLNGAASVVDRLINPHKGAVEKVTGYILLVVSSNAGKGLIDLVEGRCDASLASASVETVVQAARAAGTEVDISKLQMTVVKNDEVVFIVHPSNPASRLTWEQIRDIHTGKITNWKDVGGKDVPIVVFTDSLASATRGLIKQAVMGGQEYGPEAKALDAVKEVNDRVAVIENGIGGLGLGFVDPKTVRVIDSKKIERPLGFITIGPPSDKVRKVIEAFKTEAR
jgi:phosphate transport system substrate-binding protein